VADFVGRVNVLPGRIEGGRLNVGQWSVGSDEVLAAQGRSGAVKVYLRPEDIRVRGGGSADAALVQGRIEKIEFLGAICHVHVQVPQLSPRPLVVYLSPNFLAEQGLREGSDLPLGLMPERIKLF
jgi:iron(III) transport system ATP-binding protein